MSELLIKNARISDDQDLQDLLVKDGVFVEIGSKINREGIQTIDAQGHVVLPPLIESHIHPDKAFLEERMPNKSGTLEEAIENTAQLKAKYTYNDVMERAEKVIQWALSKGTTFMRAHPDIDPFEKLLGVEVLLELKEKYKGMMDLQIVAFPQEGILKSEGVHEMLEEAIQMGADVVGACPYVEETEADAKRHIDLVFGLAEKHNLPLDMHVDFADHLDDPRYTLTEYICEKTTEYGFQGKVSLGHVTTLGSYDVEKVGPLFDKIAEAGITIVPLPATDLYLNGREAKKDVPRGMAPVQALLEHGVNMVYASNNIRNAFTPFGNTDILAVGYLLAETQHMGSAEQQRQVVDMVTTNAAKALGMEESYGIEEGKPANLVIFQSKKISDLIQDQPLVLSVIREGKVLLENKLETTYSSEFQQLMDKGK